MTQMIKYGTTNDIANKRYAVNIPGVSQARERYTISSGTVRHILDKPRQIIDNSIHILGFT